MHADHSFIQSVSQSFSHSVIQSFIYSFIHSFIRSLVHSFVRSFIHSFVHSLIHWFMHPSPSLPASLPPSMHTLHYITLHCIIYISKTYPNGETLCVGKWWREPQLTSAQITNGPATARGPAGSVSPNSDKFARSDSSACPQIIPNLFLLLTPLMIDVFWSLFLWR